jgi:tRNA-specific 2-thiouridylase
MSAAAESMRIAALCSGGVDSSVALALLKQQGHDITAFYIKVWMESDVSSSCPWQEDLDFVKKTCEMLKVPLQIVNLQNDYWSKVVSYLLTEARKGRTPNPDMLCNSCIKFGAFLDSIEGYDKVATGHYAQLEEKNGLYWLVRAKDEKKDQTYFLSRLTQEQLSKALFPIGHLAKKEVRELAKKMQLPAASRKDSQGICFLGKIRYDRFLKEKLGMNEGELLDTEGKVIGRHQGHWFYTIGQRRRVAIPDGPAYVVAKNAEANTVTVSKMPEERETKQFIVKELNWLAQEPESSRLLVKIRHGPAMSACMTAKKQNSIVVTLDKPEKGIAPGQFAAFYDDKYCYGSGVIV